jgi:hypothetical protein
MDEFYLTGIETKRTRRCGRSHDPVETVHVGDREEFGGVEVFECPECGHRSATKAYPFGMTWSPSLFDDHETVTIEETDDDHRPYRLSTGHPGDQTDCRTRRQAEDLAALAVLTGFTERESGERGVPPSVAAAGTPEVVTYLLAHPDSGVAGAEALVAAWDLDHETVRSHLSDVRARSEEFR